LCLNDIDKKEKKNDYWRKTSFERGLLNDCNKDSDIRVDGVLIVPVWDDGGNGRGWYTDAKCSSCSSVKTWSEPVLSSSSSVTNGEFPSLVCLSWVLWKIVFVCLSELITTICGGVWFEERRNWSL